MSPRQSGRMTREHRSPMRRMPGARAGAAEAVSAAGELATRLAGALGGLVAPPGCVVCRAGTSGPRERLCPVCVRALPWLRPGCPRCGLPTHRRGCPAAGAAYPRAWAPLAYEGVARGLVGALEVHRAPPVAGPVAAPMAPNPPPPPRARPTGP